MRSATSIWWPDSGGVETLGSTPLWGAVTNMERDSTPHLTRAQRPPAQNRLSRLLRSLTGGKKKSSDADRRGTLQPSDRPAIVAYRKNQREERHQSDMRMLERTEHDRRSTRNDEQFYTKRKGYDSWANFLKDYSQGRVDLNEIPQRPPGDLAAPGQPMKVPRPPNESKRMDAYRRIAPSLPGQNEDPLLLRLVTLARKVFGTRVALISLIDENMQYYKAEVGLKDHFENEKVLEGNPRDIVFCGHTILRPEVFTILDTHKDWRWDHNPLVEGPKAIRFYAGVPLVSQDGYPLGTMCVLDDSPRAEFSNLQQEKLKQMALIAMKQLRTLYERSQLQRALEDTSAEQEMQQVLSQTEENFHHGMRHSLQELVDDEETRVRAVGGTSRTIRDNQSAQHSPIGDLPAEENHLDVGKAHPDTPNPMGTHAGQSAQDQFPTPPTRERSSVGTGSTHGINHTSTPSTSPNRPKYELPIRSPVRDMPRRELNPERPVDAAFGGSENNDTTRVGESEMPRQQQSNLALIQELPVHTKYKKDCRPSPYDLATELIAHTLRVDLVYILGLKTSEHGPPNAVILSSFGVPPSLLQIDLELHVRALESSGAVYRSRSSGAEYASGAVIPVMTPKVRKRESSGYLLSVFSKTGQDRFGAGEVDFLKTVAGRVVETLIQRETDELHLAQRV